MYSGKTLEEILPFSNGRQVVVVAVVCKVKRSLRSPFC